MKITIKKILFLLMILLFSATSCDGFFDENETEENLLPEPTITKNNESIIISCNAGSADSFSWINIFRREKITNATERICVQWHSFLEPWTFPPVYTKTKEGRRIAHVLG